MDNNYTQSKSSHMEGKDRPPSSISERDEIQ